MSKTFTPKYRVEYRDNDTKHSADTVKAWANIPRATKIVAWNSKDYGAANAKNLEQWRVKMNESFGYGGVNYHISLACGYIVHISHARIVNQKTGEIVASVTMPAFEIV